MRVKSYENMVRYAINGVCFLRRNELFYVLSTERFYCNCSFMFCFGA